jgi:hypothetical protein
MNRGGYPKGGVPDGLMIAYQSREKTSGFGTVHLRRADGTGDVEALTSEPSAPTSWSSDGGYLFTGARNFAMRDGRRLVNYLRTPQVAIGGNQITRDGKWIAYVSNESGELQIYVRPFPDVESGKWPISKTGGTEPHWRGDGKELYYRSSDNEIVAVSVKAEGSQFEVLGTSVLFKVPIANKARNYTKPSIENGTRRSIFTNASPFLKPNSKPGSHFKRAITL